jgi:hypothetical protein
MLRAGILKERVKKLWLAKCTCCTLHFSSQAVYFKILSWWIWIFSQIPGPSSSLFRRVLLRFSAQLTGGSYYSTSRYRTCTVYRKKDPCTGIPCTTVRVLDLKN